MQEQDDFPDNCVVLIEAQPGKAFMQGCCSDILLLFPVIERTRERRGYELLIMPVYMRLCIFYFPFLTVF